MLHTNLVKIGPVVHENMLTMTDDDGRQPIAIGHLSDSGDLKMCLIINLDFESF